MNYKNANYSTVNNNKSKIKQMKIEEKKTKTNLSLYIVTNEAEILRVKIIMAK